MHNVNHGIFEGHDDNMTENNEEHSLKPKIDDADLVAEFMREITSTVTSETVIGLKMLVITACEECQKDFTNPVIVLTSETDGREGNVVCGDHLT